MTTSDKAAQPLTAEDLRKCATCVCLGTDASVAGDIARHLLWAADTIDAQAAKPPTVPDARVAELEQLLLSAQGSINLLLKEREAAKPPAVQWDRKALQNIIDAWWNNPSRSTYDLTDALISALPGLTTARAADTPPANFDEWWDADGKFIDPDFSDVPWFDKRKGLAAYAYDAGVKVGLTTAAPGAGWRDISTLPKDGTRCLVWIDIRGLHVTDRSYARVACLGATGFTDGHAGLPIANITHWMPLPNPPAPSPEEK